MYSQKTDIQEPEKLNVSQQKTATELVWPASRRQQKFASRVRNGLANVLMKDSGLRQSLVHDVGLNIIDVRMSPDNLKAFILWDSYLEKTVEAEKEIKRGLSKLRSSLAKELGARHVPRLEFRLDRPSAEEVALERAFKQIEEERNVT